MKKTTVYPKGKRPVSSGRTVSANRQTGKSKRTVMASSGGYNGWANWATWYTSMILGDMKDQILSDFDGDEYELAQTMEQYFDEVVYDLDGVSRDSLIAEFAQATIDEIDFREIAETWMIDIGDYR